MLKRLVNELHCTLVITTTGPVLVRSGHASISGPDMTPVRTYRNGKWEVYLPGSSLKGVVRSHLEKICRTLNPAAVCNPFLKASDAAFVGGTLNPAFTEISCSDKFETRKKGKLRLKDRSDWRRSPEDPESDNERIYADSCPICRLFGSNFFIARVSSGDAYRVGAPTPDPVETRDGVGIDRITGGAAHGAKFELQTVSAGSTFETDVLVRNFEVWQLGMLLAVVADLRDGLVRIGSGRSRGLGAVTGSLRDVQVSLLASPADRAPGEIWGLGHILGDRSYGTLPDDRITVSPAPEQEPRGLRQVARFGGESLAALEAAAVRVFARRIDEWPVPEAMRWPGGWQRGARS